MFSMFVIQNVGQTIQLWSAVVFHTHTPASLVMFLVSCQGFPPFAGLPFGEREISLVCDEDAEKTDDLQQLL